MALSGSASGGKVFEMMHQKCFVVLYRDSVTFWKNTVGDNTIDITSHSKRHFDPNGFLANFLQTWTAWTVSFVQLLFQFRLVCLYPGFVKGNNMA
jgi:hypothetical protein